MNSKKAKDIKKELELILNSKGGFVDLSDYENVFLNILTYINELEKENEILRNAKVVHETVDYCYEDLKKAENKIAELEKENDELKVDLKNSIDMQKQMLDGFKIATKEVEENLTREIPNLLKQFAERLKEKFAPYSYVIVKLDSIYDKIDETLKEFIK